MSYINDALHKVQQEKESPYDSYGHIVSTGSKKPGAGGKRALAAGLLVLCVIAASLVFLLYRQDDSRMPGAVTLTPSKASVLSPPAQSMPPAEVLKTEASRSAAWTDVAAPLSAAMEKKSTSDQALTTEVKEKNQQAVMTVHEPKPETIPQPAPVSAGDLYAQALQKQREGRLEEAKALYRQVIKKEPGHLQALNNLGVIHLKLKKYDWAISRFNNALDIKHDYVDAHYNLACLYAQKNDTKRSLFYLKNAIDFNPEVRQWAATDDDLKNIVHLPEFNKILQARDR